MQIKKEDLLLVKPFSFAHICLMFCGACAVYLIWFMLGSRPEESRERFLLILCLANIALFVVYKFSLSVDEDFVRISGHEKFNWFNELPLQLCNINLFLIPLGILTGNRAILGFSFFIAPLGAIMALFFPEAAFDGYSLLLPRMIGFYFTHLLLIVCSISLMTLGFYKPEYADFPNIIIAFILLSLGVHFINIILRHTVCPFANYFFSFGSNVSILKFFWNILPIPYMYLLVPALSILSVYMTAVTFCINAVEQLH